MSKYRTSISVLYRIELALTSIPWHPRVFFMQTLNESFDVPNIELVHIDYIGFVLIGIVSNSIPISISNTRLYSYKV